MTPTQALQCMSVEAPLPWLAIRSWFSERMTPADFDTLEQGIRSLGLPDGFTTHEIARRAGRTMPADALAYYGELLWPGQDWRAAMAEELMVDRSEIERWANGERAPPPDVWAELKMLARLP